MGKPGVVVMDTDLKQGQEVCALLKKLDYWATPCPSLQALERHLQKNSPQVLILNLDTVAADNQFFRTLKRENRHLCILVVSRLPYHPGLAEAMGSYIYACLPAPLDPEELVYWLKSISENTCHQEGSLEE